ncbi:hypothetical protein [Bacillus xiapuensis]|uniref:Uncharacterized protein n=1 Tax=Bacillus xiapuensis TaxID=2014075 RepID=A0ABU6NA97_9BACI|nr:hypothetical protein [Bacillus xiapuensis]
MRLLVMIIMIVLFWLLCIGWSWLFNHNFTIDDVESSALSFLVGIVISMLVGGSKKK